LEALGPQAGAIISSLQIVVPSKLSICSVIVSRLSFAARPMPSNVTEGALQLSKLSLRQEQEVFEAEAIVDEAAVWADSLLSRSYRGPGDTIEAASYRAEQSYGVPASMFWALRYRKPKAILAHVYLRLKAAYEHECQRQEAKLRHELALTKEILGDAAAANPAVQQAEAALGSAVPAEDHDQSREWSGVEYDAEDFSD
jgi:hypothetical protein